MCVYWWVVEQLQLRGIRLPLYQKREADGNLVCCLSPPITLVAALFIFLSLLPLHWVLLPKPKRHKLSNHVSRSKGSKARSAGEDSPGGVTSVQGGQVNEWKLRCIIQKCRGNGGAIHCISRGAEWVAQEPRRWWMQHSLGFAAWCHCVWCCLFNEDTSQRRIMFGILWSASEKLLQWIRIQILCVWS